PLSPKAWCLSNALPMEGAACQVKSSLRPWVRGVRSALRKAPAATPGAGITLNIKIKFAAGGPFLGERPGSVGCWGWRGGLWFGVVGSGVCSLLGRAPEAIRNLPGGQAAEASRCADSCIPPLDLPTEP